MSLIYRAMLSEAASALGAVRVQREGAPAPNDIMKWFAGNYRMFLIAGLGCRCISEGELQVRSVGLHDRV